MAEITSDFDFGDSPEPQTKTETDPAVSSPPGRIGPPIPKSAHPVWDLETGPAWLSDSTPDAKAFCQPLGIDYDPDSIGPHPGNFDRKYWLHRVSKKGGGTLVDSQKIKDNVNAKEVAHTKKLNEWKQKKESGHDVFWRGIIDKAALSPVTGKILACGVLLDGEVWIGSGDELEIIHNCFMQFEVSISGDRKETGWNIFGFDLPFLLWRAAFYGVPIPHGFRRGRYYSDVFVDCMDLWPKDMFDPWKRKNGPPTAKHAANFFGCQRPENEIEGKDFWRYFTGSDEDRELSLRYLGNDVIEEGIIARALGVI